MLIPEIDCPNCMNDMYARRELKSVLESGKGFIFVYQCTGCNSTITETVLEI